VERFCEVNGIQMVVRGHECVMDGFERFASGRLVTVFSATNYCGVVGNSGCGAPPSLPLSLSLSHAVRHPGEAP
jgi:hypothetical protein